MLSMWCRLYFSFARIVVFGMNEEMYRDVKAGGCMKRPDRRDFAGMIELRMCLGQREDFKYNFKQVARLLSSRSSKSPQEQSCASLPQIIR